MQFEESESSKGKTSSTTRVHSDSKRDRKMREHKEKSAGLDVKHSRSVTKVKHSFTKSLCQPLQESKITSTGHAATCNSTIGSEVSESGCDITDMRDMDVNNNFPEINMSKRKIANDGHEIAYSERDKHQQNEKQAMKTKHKQRKSKSHKERHSHVDKEKKRRKEDLDKSVNSPEYYSSDGHAKDPSTCQNFSTELKENDCGDGHVIETVIKEENRKEQQICDAEFGDDEVIEPIKKKRKRENENTEVKGKTGDGMKDGKLGREKKKKHLADSDEPKSNKRVKNERVEKGNKQKSKKDEMKSGECNKWKWWEEGKSSDGQKWRRLEHKGPLFPPEYEPLPKDVCLHYNGEPLQLSLASEEIATFYAKMLDHEYTSKEIFQKNFFTDWREEMTAEERKVIKSLSKCDFSKIHKYFADKAEEKRNMTKEEKQVLKEETSRLTEEHGFCLLDGHQEKIGNFRVEPPGLFRGRGEHPKMGKLKKRIQPEDVIINCSEDSKIPVPPKGHKWKRVQNDNTVTWLASWVENIQGHPKYIMLNPSSKLKGEKDWQKYEMARRLNECVEAIRKQYRQDWDHREMKTRQRGVALYFIDKLALRAGNEKEDETADTVGCCSLRVEHITLHRQLDGQEHVVEFDFLGKDSIRYYNKVPVEKRVFKNLKLFKENKDPDDDLFDRITTTYLNKTLNESMPGLSAKVFRTFNASTTLQEQLSKLTTDDMSLEEKILSYNRANRAVAILCNHQRAAPKSFEKSMQLLQEKITKKKEQIRQAKSELKQAKRDYKENSTEKLKKQVEKKAKTVQRLEEQLKKLELQVTDREENKVIALGTSKLNYLDPRISVAWCKKHKVPVEKIYNKTQRDKFAWAIDMADENFVF